MSQVRAVRLLVAGALALTLTACAGASPGAPATSAAPGTTTPAPAPTPGPAEDVVATAVMHSGWNVTADVAVHPLVRVDQHVVLTVDFSAFDPAAQDAADALLHSLGASISAVEMVRPPVAVRLLDLEHDVVHHVARTKDGSPLMAVPGWTSGAAGAERRLQVAYAAPPDDVTSMSLFLPGAPLFADVPVIEGEPPSPLPPAVAAATSKHPPLELTRAVAAPTFPLESATVELLPYDGGRSPVGAAGQGVLVVNDDASWQIDATARRVHGYLVVDLVVAAPEGQPEATYGGTSVMSRSYRGDGTSVPPMNAANLTVVHGESRLHPVDYRTGTPPRSPGGEWWPVADLTAAANMLGGQERVFTYVFPRLDADRVTLQVGQGNGWPTDFRLTDVPVLAEESFPPAG